MKKYAEFLIHNQVIRHIFEFPEELGAPQYSEESGLMAIDITDLNPPPLEGWQKASDGTFKPPAENVVHALNPPSIPLHPSILAEQNKSDSVGALDWLNDETNATKDELTAIRHNVWGGLLIQSIATEDFTNLQKYYVKLKETAGDPLADRILYFGKMFLTQFRLPIQP